MTDKVIIGIPSKGRLMDKTLSVFAECGVEIRKTGNERGYLGEIDGLRDAEVQFLSAGEISQKLKSGIIHIGVTGEDLVREAIADADQKVQFIAQLGFGHANVVIAVPACWLDARRVTDLEEISDSFMINHGRRLRIATKYANITRRFLASKGVTGYRIVESLGATEGAPASGAAELIVDITTTGATLSANHLRVLDDGVILSSQANLISSGQADWHPAACEARNELAEAFSKIPQSGDQAP